MARARSSGPYLVARATLPHSLSAVVTSAAKGPGRVIAARGADLQVVKERLGHGSLRATERYLHTLPDADETALDAFAKVRNRRSAG